MEVRFADEAAVREQVEAAVREALLSNGLLRSGAPRGRSAPAETDVDPEPGDDVPVRDRTSAPADDGASSRGGNADGAAHAERRRGAFDRDTGLADRSDRGSTSTPAVRGNELRPVRGGEGDAGGADRTFDATEQRTLDGEPAPAERRFETLPPLGVLGQYDDTYVVAAGPGGLVLIDQHAADERVNYERLRERVDGASATQVLADPVEVALTAGEAAAFGDARATLEAAGFRARRAGERSVEVTGVPAVLSESLDPELLRDVLGRTLRDADGDRPVAARADALLADLACYPSITGNTSLTEGSVLALLSALDDCENPYACPHGRPVLVELSDDELEARFERDYPGHGGRRE